VYDLVANKNAIFYICGDGKYMAKDVYSAMLKLVVMEGSLSEEDAMKFIERLQKEGRYVQDVWG
jgi:sulfite reductase alpha subunit-like flavoprotein